MTPPISVAFVLMAFLIWIPGGTDAQTIPEGAVHKVVIGDDAPAGPYFVDYDCGGPVRGTITVSAGGTVSFPAQGSGTCTFTEPDPLGAHVSFACEASPPATCVNDNTFTLPFAEGASATITVTNDFRPVEPTTTSPNAPTSGARESQKAAAPTFTG